MSSPVIRLRGITWNHSRGYVPMVATAQRFSELNPGIEIAWEKRSLKAFEDMPVERLAASYDLIVLDHPGVSLGARNGALLPLDEHLPKAFLDDQADHSVGPSFSSYAFNAHQWALAIDAATPVAFWREDLMQSEGIHPPTGWDGLMMLARAGRVEVPAAPINCLMNFYALCAAEGEPPFLRADRVVAREVACAAFQRLRALLAHCDARCWFRDPIASHDLAASAANSRILYCPFTYGYSNYARDGYAAHRLAFGEPPAPGREPLRTTLGGAGLGVSAMSRHPAEAVAYARFVADPVIQRTQYARTGGQPGHRLAWLDEENNRETHNYFTSTLPVLDRALLRPRAPGYLRFQDRAGPVLHAALRSASDPGTAFDEMDALARRIADNGTEPAACRPGAALRSGSGSVERAISRVKPADPLA